MQEGPRPPFRHPWSCASGRKLAFFTNLVLAHFARRLYFFTTANFFRSVMLFFCFLRYHVSLFHFDCDILNILCYLTRETHTFNRFRQQNLRTLCFARYFRREANTTADFSRFHNCIHCSGFVSTN